MAGIPNEGRALEALELELRQRARRQVLLLADLEAGGWVDWDVPPLMQEGEVGLQGLDDDALRDAPAVELSHVGREVVDLGSDRRQAGVGVEAENVVAGIAGTCCAIPTR